MTALILIFLIAAAVTFGYLVYRVGWAEATAATALLFGSIWTAVWVFLGNFGSGGSGL